VLQPPGPIARVDYDRKTIPGRVYTHRGIITLSSSPIKDSSMTVDRAVMIFAGCVVLVSVLLVATVSAWWLLLTTFVGLNLIQSAFTGFCPAAIVFRKIGVKPGVAFQ